MLVITVSAKKEKETRERLSTGRTGEASKIPREMCKEAHFLRCDPEPASLCALDTLLACLILSDPDWIPAIFYS